jgi:Putative sensor
MTPDTIASYLDALRAALAGAPPGLIADALADAQDHFRGAQAASPGLSEAQIVASYGTPEDVAAEYRASDTPAALPSAVPVFRQEQPVAGSPYPGFFGVMRDPVTYGALLYMLLALPLGVFYFSWSVTGLSLSLGLLVLIIGIPFFALFVGSIRMLAHVEGRVVEALLGVRMPRRLPASLQHLGFWARVKDMFLDPRTWSSIAYMLLMLPLGIFYFVCAVVGLSLSGALAAIGLWDVFDFMAVRVNVPGENGYGLDFGHGGLEINHVPDWMTPLMHTPLPGLLWIALGVLVFFCLAHLARGIGYLHGRIAEHLLVRL